MLLLRSFHDELRHEKIFPVVCLSKQQRQYLLRKVETSRASKFWISGASLKGYVVAFKEVPWTLCDWLDTEARKMWGRSLRFEECKISVPGEDVLIVHVLVKSSWKHTFRTGLPKKKIGVQAGMFLKILVGCSSTTRFRNASLLCCGAWVPNTNGHGGFGAFWFSPPICMINQYKFWSKTLSLILTDSLTIFGWTAARFSFCFLVNLVLTKLHQNVTMFWYTVKPR